MHHGAMLGMAFRHGSLHLLDRRVASIQSLVYAVMDNLALRIAKLESQIETA
jgi:hypothetical protein